MAFVIIFGIRLHAWYDNVKGACYHTNRLSISDAAHPLVGEVYLVITSIYSLAALSAPLEITSFRLRKRLQSLSDSLQYHPSLASEITRATISTALLTFSPMWPLRLLENPLSWFLETISSNESYLSGDSENQWGFGQIAALVLLTSVVYECIRGVVGE